MMVGVEWHIAPVLQRDDAKVAQMLLPLTAMTLLVSNAATLRSRRHGTDELYSSASTPAHDGPTVYV